MSLDTDIQYYQGQLIQQFKELPKAKATISAVVNCNLCEGLPQAEQASWNIATAVGNQLDVIGRIVGVKRQIFGSSLSRNYFQFCRAAAHATPPAGHVGFGRITDSPYPTALFYRAQYSTAIVYSLTDYEFRTLIYLKIICNNTKRTTKAITEALYAQFGNDISMVDNLDMTLSYTFAEKYVNVKVAALQLKCLPKSMGRSAS